MGIDEVEDGDGDGKTCESDGLMCRVTRVKCAIRELTIITCTRI